MEPSTNSANTADAPCPHCGCLMWFDAQQVRVSELVEETKLQIRQWKNRFTELSQSATDSDAYYHEMLTGVIQALAAKGGAVWTRERGRMQLQIKVGIGSETIDDRPIFRPSHLSLLTNAITAARSAVVQPSGHGPSLRGNSNPTEFLLVLAPIKRKAKAIALIEIFQRTGSSISVQRGYLRFLEQVCEIAGNSAVVDDGKTE